MSESDKPDLKKPVKQLPLPAREVRRFKRAMWMVLGLSVAVFTALILFGDAPRPFVNRMNLVLTPVVLLMFGILAHALWRFRSRCGDWPGRIGKSSS